MSDRVTCTHCGELEPDWWRMSNVTAFHWWREHGGTEAFTKQRSVRGRCHEQWFRIHDGQAEKPPMLAFEPSARGDQGA